MSFELTAIYSSPNVSDFDFVFHYDFTDVDPSSPNYWDDVSSTICDLLFHADCHLRSKFPHGHDYSLRLVYLTSIDFKEG